MTPPVETWRDGLITDEREIPGPVIEDWKAVRESYGSLIDAGIVRLFDPETLIQQNDRLLGHAVKADLYNNEFWRLCTGPGTPDTWSILRRKIPNSAFEFLNSQVAPRINYGTARARAVFHKQVMDWPNLRGLVDANETDPFKMPDMGSYNMAEWHRFLFHDSKVAWNIDHGRYSRSRKKSTEPLEFSCLCPFTHGSSIVLNEALIIADQYNLIPFTNSVLHHQLLDVKYESTRTILATGKAPMLSGAAPLDPLKLRRVALTLFDALVSEDILDALTIEHALKYRQGSQDAFRRLKELIAKLTSEIEAEVWDDKFEAEIQKLVHQKIVPEAQKARDSAVSIYEKLFGKLLQRAALAASPTVGASIFTGLSFPMMLTVGVASVAGAVLPDLIEGTLEDTKNRRNSMAYLMELKK